MLTLYQIKDTYLYFLDKVAAGEVPEESIADTLESIEGEFEEKADNIACLIKTLIAEADAIKLEEENLKKRRETKERHIERLKEYLSNNMLQLGKSKIETARNILSFKKSASLQIADENSFIKKYPDLIKVEVERTIPKKDITDLIKSGEALDGAVLVEKQNLQIK